MIYITTKEEAIKLVKEKPLDRERWIALGKAMGWKKACMEDGFGVRVDESGYHNDCGRCTGRVYEGWHYILHRFIDHLAEGKSPEEFFESLTAK